ncbi:hypothetical protein, partial [Streptococcus suis]
MKYQKIVTGASLIGLITFLLPVVSGEGYSLAPISQEVVNYLDVPSVFILFILWYGAFTLALLISIFSNKTLPFGKIKTTIIILLSVYSIFVQLSITSELLGNTGGLGIGGILYYLCAVINIFASVMMFKDNGIKIEKEDLMKVAEKGLTFGKATA